MVVDDEVQVFLTIKAVDDVHFGGYTLSAVNDVGNSSAAVKLVRVFVTVSVPSEPEPEQQEDEGEEEEIAEEVVESSVPVKSAPSSVDESEPPKITDSVADDTQNVPGGYLIS